MKKPTIKNIWKGVKGNKYQSWTVQYKGKSFHHRSKGTAMKQYNSAMRIWNKRK